MGKGAFLRSILLKAKAFYTAGLLKSDSCSFIFLQNLIKGKKEDIQEQVLFITGYSTPYVTMMGYFTTFGFCLKNTWKCRFVDHTMCFSLLFQRRQVNANDR